MRILKFVSRRKIQKNIFMCERTKVPPRTTVISFIVVRGGITEPRATWPPLSTPLENVNEYGRMLNKKKH